MRFAVLKATFKIRENVFPTSLNGCLNCRSENRVKGEKLHYMRFRSKMEGIL